MNCKPGDLAFIIRSDFPENVGRIVRVVSAIGNRPFQGGIDFMWLVYADGSVVTASFNGEAVQVREGCIGDSLLRPIRPEPELLPAPPVAVTA